MKASKPSTTDKCAAVILTGGISRRMGRDKAGLMIGGLTLLDRAAESLKEFFDPIFISVRHERQQLPAGCRAIKDRYTGCGPMAGLDSAFATTDAQQIFLCAVDLPFLDAEAARKMAQQLGEYDACVIRRENGKTEPLFAVYSRSCHTAAVSLLESGDYKMGSLLERCNTRYLTPEELGISELLFTNVNTPEEFDEALRHING